MMIFHSYVKLLEGKRSQNGVSIHGEPANGWFKLENPIKVDEFGWYPYFRKPPNGDLVDITMEKGSFIVELPTNNGDLNDLP